MTRKEYRKMIRSLAKVVQTSIINHAETVLKSECIDLPSADNWGLPKNVVQAVLETNGRFFPPHKRSDRKTIDNIKHFI